MRSVTPTTHTAAALFHKSSSSRFAMETVQQHVGQWRSQQQEDAEVLLSKRQALKHVAQVLRRRTVPRTSQASLAKKQSRKAPQHANILISPLPSPAEEREQAPAGTAEVSTANSASCCAREDDDLSSICDSDDNSQTPQIDLSLQVNPLSYDDSEDDDSILYHIPEISFDTSCASVEQRDDVGGNEEEDDDISLLSSSSDAAADSHTMDYFDLCIFQKIVDPFPDLLVDVDFRPLP
jgi:hypothetical protein